MLVYLNGNTTHLFPYCRGTYGVPRQVDKPICQCRICLLRAQRIERGREIEKLLAQGMTMEQIGEQMGISRQAVYSLVQRTREEPCVS